MREERAFRLLRAFAISAAVLFSYIVFHTLARSLFYSCALLCFKTEFAGLLYRRSAAALYVVAALVFSGILCALLLLLRAKTRNIRSFTDFLLPARGRNTLWICLLLPIAGMTVNLAMTNWISCLPVPQSWLDANQNSVNAFAECGLVSRLLAQSLAAPLAEELIFRGVLYNSWLDAKLFSDRRVSRAVGALLVSAAFGWFHGNALQAVYCACFSLILIFVYEETQSVWPCVLTHVGFNSTWLLVALISDWYRARESLLNAVIFSAGSAILFIFLHLLTESQDKRPPRPESRPSQLT